MSILFLTLIFVNCGKLILVFYKYIRYNQFVDRYMFFEVKKMKLFKNRGDFYIPKSKKASNQAKILYSLLVIIVVFTVVFVGVLHSNYKTVSDFFARGEVTTTEVQEEGKAELPDITGKTNFLIFETDDSKEKIHYIFLLQADKDNKAYKVASLSPKMKIADESLQKIYSSGGGTALKAKLIEYFGFQIDYYIDFDSSSFIEFINKLGSYIYTSNEEIVYSENTEEDNYTLKIEVGEQKIEGKETSNLLRYFTEKTKNYSAENELILTCIPELFNADNYENAESLFKLFMKSCKTDITVRDFENSKNAVEVFCTLSNEVTLYSSTTEFDKNNNITTTSIRDIKGYFNKD